MIGLKKSNAIPKEDTSISPVAGPNDESQAPTLPLMPEEGHPQESRIELASLNINPSTLITLSEQFVRLPSTLAVSFRTPYFRLFETLCTRQDKFLLLAAILLSLLAGLPLPIIGVIFG